MAGVYGEIVHWLYALAQSPVKARKRGKLGACAVHLRSVLQPGNALLAGPVPSGVPYPVLRYNGAATYTACAAFPCAGACHQSVPSSCAAFMSTAQRMQFLQAVLQSMLALAVVL
jgi:hypothetical protein